MDNLSKKISTRLAKKIAIQDIVKDSELKSYTNLLTMSLKTQLSHLPAECRVSIDDLDIDNMKRISPPGYSFYLPRKFDRSIQINLYFTDKITKRRNYWYVSKYIEISRSCLFFIQSFAPSVIKRDEEGKYIVNAVKLVRHSRYVSENYLKHHTKDVIQEYNNMMIDTAYKCERYYERFNLNEYQK